MFTMLATRPSNRRDPSHGVALDVLGHHRQSGEPTLRPFMAPGGNELALRSWRGGSGAGRRWLVEEFEGARPPWRSP